MNTATHRNGCHNRAPYRSHIARDGYWCDGHVLTIKAVSIAHRMSKPCQYTLSSLGQADKGCTGCRHKQDLHKGIKYE
jgi:hypothetical protein